MVDSPTSLNSTPVTPVSINSENLPSPDDNFQVDTGKVDTVSPRAPLSPLAHMKDDDDPHIASATAPSPVSKSQDESTPSFISPRRSRSSLLDQDEKRAISNSATDLSLSLLKEDLLSEIQKRDEIISTLNADMHRYQQALSSQRNDVRSMKSHLVKSIRSQEQLQEQVNTLQTFCHNMRKEHERLKATMKSTIETIVNDRLRAEVTPTKVTPPTTNPPPRSSSPKQISKTPRGRRSKVASYQNALDKNHEWLDSRGGSFSKRGAGNQSPRSKRFEKINMTTAEIITNSYERLSKKQKELDRSKSPFYEYRGGGYTPKSMSRNRISHLPETPMQSCKEIIAGEYKVRRGSTYDQLINTFVRHSPSSQAPSPHRSPKPKKKKIKKVVPTAQPKSPRTK